MARWPGAGLVTLAKPATFNWPGYWLAVLGQPGPSADAHDVTAVLMCGTPSGVVLSPQDPSLLGRAATDLPIREGYVLCGLDPAYRLRPGAEPGPMVSPIAYFADFDGYQCLVFLHEAGHFSVVLVRPTARTPPSKSCASRPPSRRPAKRSRRCPNGPTRPAPTPPRRCSSAGHSATSTADKPAHPELLAQSPERTWTCAEAKVLWTARYPSDSSKLQFVDVAMGSLVKPANGQVLARDMSTTPYRYRFEDPRFRAYLRLPVEFGAAPSQG